MVFLYLLKDMERKPCWIAWNVIRKNGVVYHRQGIVGDYDEFDDVEELIRFIKEGK